jgi:hypothetical protein
MVRAGVCICRVIFLTGAGVGSDRRALSTPLLPQVKARLPQTPGNPKSPVRCFVMVCHMNREEEDPPVSVSHQHSFCHTELDTSDGPYSCAKD